MIKHEKRENEVGNHDCEYSSESEDARCPICGLTSGEAVEYFERIATELCNQHGH